MRLLALLALASTASAADEGPRPIVALTFEGDAADRIAFTRSLGELLRRLEVELTPRVTDAPLPKDRVIAEITGDWTSPTEATVTIVDAQQRVVLVRRLARTGSAPLVIEAAAHISHSVIEELIAPSAVPPPLVTIVELPRPAPTPEPVPLVESSGPIGLELSGFFGGRAQANTAPVAFGGGLLTDVGLTTTHWRPSIWLFGEYQAPVEIRSVEPVQFNVQSVALRAGLKATVVSGDSWRLDTGLGAGADLFLSTTHAPDLPQNRLTPSRLDASPMLALLVAGHLAVARSADVWLAVSVDLDLEPRVFVAHLPEKEEIFHPWRVRPALILGFSFSAVGSDPYKTRVGAGL